MKSEFEIMPAIVDFVLTHTDRKINWEKVEHIYGKKQADHIRKWREVLRS